MAKVELEITDNLLYNLGLPPQQAEQLLRRELALALCEQGRLSGAAAGRFADLPAPDFDARLRERRRVRETEEFLDREPGAAAGDYKPPAQKDGGKAKTVLQIPEEVQAALNLPPEKLLPELRKELALDLYEQWILGSGPVRRYADLSWWEFFDLRGERDMVIQYSAKCLEEDLSYALGRPCSITAAPDNQ